MMLTVSSEHHFRPASSLFDLAFRFYILQHLATSASELDDFFSPAGLTHVRLARMRSSSSSSLALYILRLSSPALILEDFSTMPNLAHGSIRLELGAIRSSLLLHLYKILGPCELTSRIFRPQESEASSN